MAKKHNLSKEQDIAANPTENVWVQANAGTGKTSVLIGRLLRILFRSENDANKKSKPSGILCLTYTNAGASEMRNRILKSLRGWATASDADLSEMLDGVSINKSITNTDLSHARNIFYQYIDNPDILKIKTIHGFCEEILRRFPIEAGISPAWNLVSDYNQKVLLNDAFHRLINSKTNDTDTIKNAFSDIVERVSEYSMDELLETLTGQYRQFFQVDDLSKYREYFIEKARYFLDLDSPVETEFSAEKLQNIIKTAEIDIKSSKKPAGYLINIVELTKQYIDKAIDFEKYKTAYLTASDTKNLNVSKKDYLSAEQDRVHTVNQYRINEQLFKDTIALFDLSMAFSKAYKQIKAERNLLDFDDLILYTKKLFSKPDVMGWILSQLDSSLSHILVDEAQDTSPDQWDILKLLSGDFFTDGDTEYGARSLFVVGDVKQSIYSFQGADPRAFSTSREDISAQIKHNAKTIKEIPLAQSFRSAPQILRVVDYFFGNQSIRDMTGFINSDHKCFRENINGVVEIHNLVSKESDTEE